MMFNAPEHSTVTNLRLDVPDALERPCSTVSVEPLSPRSLNTATTVMDWMLKRRYDEVDAYLYGSTDAVSRHAPRRHGHVWTRDCVDLAQEWHCYQEYCASRRQERRRSENRSARKDCDYASSVTSPGEIIRVDDSSHRYERNDTNHRSYNKYRDESPREPFWDDYSHSYQRHKRHRPNEDHYGSPGEMNERTTRYERPASEMNERTTPDRYERQASRTRSSESEHGTHHREQVSQKIHSRLGARFEYPVRTT